MGFDVLAPVDRGVGFDVDLAGRRLGADAVIFVGELVNVFSNVLPGSSTSATTKLYNSFRVSGKVNLYSEKALVLFKLISAKDRASSP